jgi:hypothetical protein
MRVFYTNYHIAVNDCFVSDLRAIGLTVILPNKEFGARKLESKPELRPVDSLDNIWFFAPNEHHKQYGAEIVSWEAFLTMPPMALVIPCGQLTDDFLRFKKLRNDKDVVVLLSSLSISASEYPPDFTDYVISHDLIYHRLTTAKYKILYFNKPWISPAVYDTERTREAFEQRVIKGYINNFTLERFAPEREATQQLEIMLGKSIPIFGYGNSSGWPSMSQVQSHMIDSAFTLVFKRPETWGQTVLQSMLHGIPCIFLRQLMTSTFTQYLINEETAIIGNTVSEIAAKISSMTFHEYEVMSLEARTQAEAMTDDTQRRDKLKWLFSKLKENHPEVS